MGIAGNGGQSCGIFGTDQKRGQLVCHKSTTVLNTLLQ